MTSLRFSLFITAACTLNKFVVISSGLGCECGTPNRRSSPAPRIIGGAEYSPLRYPWLVLLQLNGTFLCGGSLISNSYVLSAAHCWNHKFNQNKLKVLLGKHNRCESDIHSSLLSVSKIIIHRKFNARNYSADIMLLKLSLKLNFDRCLRPICLPLFDVRNNFLMKYKDRIATVLGWGKISNNSKEPACNPRQLHVPILQRNQCGADLSPSLFCAGFSQGQRDSCQGDSGGPLQILSKNGRFEVIGIVSNGVGCALRGHPGFYTDVMRYLPWIRKRVRSSSLCNY